MSTTCMLRIIKTQSKLCRFQSIQTFYQIAPFLFNSKPPSIGFFMNHDLAICLSVVFDHIRYKRGKRDTTALFQVWWHCRALAINKWLWITILSGFLTGLHCSTRKNINKVGGAMPQKGYFMIGYEVWNRIFFSLKIVDQLLDIGRYCEWEVDWLPSKTIFGWLLSIFYLKISMVENLFQ